MPEARVVGEGNPYVLLELLEEAVIENSDVIIESYCDFWCELCGFLKKFGMLFGFATNDVLPKVNTLRSLYDSNNHAYRSIRSMAEYESTEEILYRETPKSGMMLLLSLHKAQVFLITLIEKIAESEDDVRMRDLAYGVYEETLANHHSWTVKRVVKTAMYFLPKKEDFLKIMRGSMPASEDDAFHKKFNTNAEIMKHRIQEIFAEYGVKV
ncbi:unnamed protein product [Auanema sp. JU1783]|nr:unnamed protein product [Auanema sp. JU1783]